MIEAVESVLGTVEGVIWTYIGVPVLVLTAIYFTVRTRGGQFRLIRSMFRSIVEPSGVDGEGRHDVSAFKSFCISAASRVGTGNIAGVAVAIAAGGPGAIFWMWVMGLLVGAMSMVESTLAQVFKTRDQDGFRGGPAYYIRNGLKKPWLAALFAVLISVVYGFVFNSIQANSITDAVRGSLPGVDPFWLSLVVGVLLVSLTAPIIFGGVRRIANISSVVIPVMALVYITICLVVLATNITMIPEVIGLIVTAAFDPLSVAGGTIGFGVVLMTGVQRGLFSNEAGMGSVPNAAATASVSHPAKQGLVQTLGVYFDTLLLCSLTAFVVLLSDWRGFMDDRSGELGAGAMTQHAISESFGALDPTLGPVMMHVVTVCIFLFAGTSLFGNYYYGETNILYMFGSRRLLNIFRVTVLGFVLLGAMVPVSLVWAMGNVAMPLMAFVNIAAIILLSPIAFKVLRNFDEQHKQGLDPTFDNSALPGVDGVESWAPSAATGRLG
ncbi:MAG: alanine/glycine:cation symporter family protein [Mycobacterium sp.]